MLKINVLNSIIHTIATNSLKTYNLRKPMREILISPLMLEKAKHKLTTINTRENLGLSKFGSEYDRILIGYIGEQIIMNYLNIETDSDTFDFDLLYNGKKLEVKTISCKFKPLPHYWCTVNSHDLNGVHKQTADYYIFLRILNDKSKGWILGGMTCKNFFEKGKFVPKGTDFGKFKFYKANATILPINQLVAIEQLLV